MEHTRELLLRAKNGDKEAGEILVQENLGLVGSVVRRFENRGYDREDLFQIGAIGLMKAIEKFDLSYEVRFSTYAVPMVTGEIRRFLRDDGMMKVSRSIKESGWRVKRSREKLEQELGRSVTVQELSDDTGLSTEEVAMAIDASEEVASIYQTIYQSDGSELYLVDKMADEQVCAIYYRLVRAGDLVKKKHSEPKLPMHTQYICEACNSTYVRDNPELPECEFCGSKKIERIGV